MTNIKATPQQSPGAKQEAKLEAILEAKTEPTLPNKGPTPLDYMSLKEFLVDCEKWAQKKSKNSYSRRNLARKAGIKSPNFLGLVISGKRRLIKNWLHGFAKAAHLTHQELNYIELLDQIENQKDPIQQLEFLSKIEKILESLKTPSKSSSILKLLQTPLAWDIIQMMDLDDCAHQAIWFKQRSRRNYSVPEILAALKLLTEHDLIAKEQTDQGLRYKILQRHLSTPDQIKPAENMKFHAHILNESLEVLKTINPSDRSFGSLTIGLNQSKIEEFKNEINIFAKKLIRKYGDKTEPLNEVFRLNVQLYPITQQSKNLKGN